jgi:hypothetical protein
MQVEDLGIEEGMDSFETSTKIALIDADTIAYAACVTNEFSEEVSDDMFDSEEWERITSDPGYDAQNCCLWYADVASAYTAAIESIQAIQMATNTRAVELYFGTGKNFRHTVDPTYKANRKGTRYPMGLLELKRKLSEEFSGCICDTMEADDMVVYKKKTHPEEYVLCAVDKDVLNAVPGTHYNYYSSVRWNIESTWYYTDELTAIKFPYIQVLMGDSADGIAGCPGIGPKKAMQALEGLSTEIDMWNAVTRLYKSKKLKEKDAIRTMRLVNMHQIDDNGEWCPWIPPREEK